MPTKATSDSEFVTLFETLGPERMAEVTGLKVRGIFSRRNRLEMVLRRQITGPAPPNNTRLSRHHFQHAGRQRCWRWCSVVANSGGDNVC
jgi:hypothetical protein